MILPHAIKDLSANIINLPYRIFHSHKFIGEVGGTYKDLMTWQHTDLNAKECSCKEWHALDCPDKHVICLFLFKRNEELETYVHDYYNMEKFKAAYAR